MGKIVYLMGKSSSGKDTIFKELMKEGTMDLRTIVPYTTRPIRAGEENGVEYFFTDEAGFQALKDQGKVIEDRAYDTVYGIIGNAPALQFLRNLRPAMLGSGAVRGYAI